MSTPSALAVQGIETGLLIKGCEHCISQCEKLLDEVTEQTYIQRVDGAASIGTHLRHILDRFQCFFAGLPTGSIDYDARKRDPAIETKLAAARFGLASLKRRLLKMEEAEFVDLTVWESIHHASPKVSLNSNVQRELMGLITHTTHHLAIIALIGKELGMEFHRDFGKAPSTIIYERT